MQAGIRPPGTLAGLAAELPGWQIWRGRDGRSSDQGWYATLRRRLSAAQAAAGLAATLNAGDSESLQAMLAQQQVIGERAARGLT